MEGIKLNTLKFLIIKSGKNQRDISMLAKIPEGRFSHIITGRLTIKDEERKKLCKILEVNDEILFKELYPN